MSSSSRRRVLGAVTTFLTGASGCSSPATAPADSPTPSPTAQEPTYERCISDPEFRAVRRSGGKASIRSSVHSPLEEDWTDTVWIVASTSERDALAYSADAVGIDTVEAFVEDTDLSARSLLLHQFEPPFEDCSVSRLTRLKLDEGRSAVALQYEHSTPPGGCEETDPNYVETTVVRIPPTFQGVPTEFSWGTALPGPNGCRVSPLASSGSSDR
jgi:hypothetical protein